jgi:hypothetical protein
MLKNTWITILKISNIYLEHKTRKDVQLKFYETIGLPSQMYGSETWNLRRTDERRLEAATLMRLLRYVAKWGHNWEWGSWTNKYKWGRNVGYTTCRECHQKELPRNFQTIHRQEDLIHEHEEADGQMTWCLKTDRANRLNPCILCWTWRYVHVYTTMLRKLHCK